jgi:glycosyltransferase involved in cell wall biosynthesis
MKLWFAIPGDLGQRTGGYGYDRRMIQELVQLGHAPMVVRLADDFPTPEQASIAAAERAFAAIPSGSDVLVDGLAFGALPRLAEREAARLNLTALVHHPLCLENGLDPQVAKSLEISEKAALCHARRIIVTGEETRREVCRRFDIDPARVHVILPGCERRQRIPFRNAPPIRIASVGTLGPRKGHDVLIGALARIADLDWCARIVGNDTLFPDVSACLKAQAEDVGLSDRIVFTGEIRDVDNELADADVFALASRYEGYGMAFAEAMAHGLPIVGCVAGAVPDVVPPSAGILVPPDDPGAFSTALRHLLTDTGARARLSNGSWEAGQRLPSWDEGARKLAMLVFDAGSGGAS